MEQVKWMNRFRRLQDEVLASGVHTTCDVIVQNIPEYEIIVLSFKFFYWDSNEDIHMKTFECENYRDERTDEEWWEFVNKCREIYENNN